MREILFRAKKVENGAWVEGDLIQLSEDDDYWYILPDGVSGEMYEKQPYHFRENDVMCEVALAYVDKDTVSEFTGLRDRNGKRIFEGDVLKFLCTSGETFYTAVEFFDGAFGTSVDLGWHNGFMAFDDREYPFYVKEGEVIGNKWDNPELLEG